MSNPIPSIPISNGDVHAMPASAVQDSNLDIGELQRRCEALIRERDGLKAELAKTQIERDGYLKTVYHFMCKDYECPYTSEELLACVGREPPLRDLISQIERELESGE